MVDVVSMTKAQRLAPTCISSRRLKFPGSADASRTRGAAVHGKVMVSFSVGTENDKFDTVGVFMADMQ